jgi:hypothetical protein
MPAMCHLGSFPPLYDADGFGRGDLAAIRERASDLLDSGFLPITESHCVVGVLERCDELSTHVDAAGAAAGCGLFLATGDAGPEVSHSA